MIISVEEAKALVDVNGWTDDKILRKLNAIEQTIRAYTNNNFQQRAYRKTADIVGGLFYMEEPLFKPGDTVQVSESEVNAGLFTVSAVAEDSIIVEEDVLDEAEVLVTKVVYPDDVVDCALNLLEWEVKNRAKVGIQSETLSRHSVTYFAQDASNQVMGYPAALLGGLKAYRKARC